MQKSVCVTDMHGLHPASAPAHIDESANASALVSFSTFHSVIVAVVNAVVLLSIRVMFSRDEVFQRVKLTVVSCTQSLNMKDLTSDSKSTHFQATGSGIAKCVVCSV